MIIKEIFQNKTEGSVVGKLECSRQALADTFINMMNFMGMSNPKSIVYSSPKAISLKKKGDKFTLILQNFQPPVKISWTGMMRQSELEEFLDKVADLNQKIAFINQKKEETGSFIQMAVA